ERLLLLIEKHTLFRSACSAIANGNLPKLLRAGRKRFLVVEEALLLESDLGLVAFTLGLDADQRNAGLGDVALHDLVHRLSRSMRHRSPEIFGRSISIGVRLQVVVDAIAECLLA